MPDTTLIENMMKKCDICGEIIITDYGHNAAPVKKGLSCDRCNIDTVIPARLQSILPKQKKKKELTEEEKEKKKIYMREYMKRYHKKKISENDTEYMAKYKEYHKKSGQKYREQDHVKEKMRIQSKEYYQKTKNKLELLRQFENSEI